MTPTRIGVVGEVFLDVHAGRPDAPPSRLGGVLHACRTLSALGAPFSCAAIMPEYLVEATIAECADLGGGCEALGLISGSPNVAIYADARESGDQGVLMPVLVGSHECTMREEALDALVQELSDALIIPGYYPFEPIAHRLADSGVRLHVDVAYDIALETVLGGPPIETIFLSTSSELFLSRWSSNPATAWDELSAITKTLVLKESRGGSRAYSADGCIFAPAFVGQTQHSIGVGDCFDATYVHLLGTGPSERLQSCSLVAAAYASAWERDQFVDTTTSILGGDPPPAHITISLPWEVRPQHSIYIAAPDFPGVNVAPLEDLLRALEYHNFHCRLPIRENGLADTTLGTEELKSFCDADLKLLDECELLLAVLLFDDPGTLIELGIAAERGVPVIVYDPYDQARNVMLRCVPNLVSSDPSAVVTEVFRAIGDAHARH